MAAIIKDAPQYSDQGTTRIVKIDQSGVGNYFTAVCRIGRPNHQFEYLDLETDSGRQIGRFTADQCDSLIELLQAAAEVLRTTNQPVE